MQGASERKTGAYTPVCEDLSTEATQQCASAVEFRKKSNDAETMEYVELDEKLITLFTAQRKLIREVGIEPAKYRKHKALFQEILDAERKIKHAISLIYSSSSYATQKESVHIIYQLPGIIVFKQEVSKWLTQISEMFPNKTAPFLHFY